MTEEVKIFASAEFGQVRVIMQDDNPWFVANDVAAALGYAQPKDAVANHCKHAKLLKGDDSSPFTKSPRGINIIPESDIYRLVIRSKLPQAEKFEVWVMEEVLPSIRKTGKYEAPIKQPEKEDFPIDEQAKVLRIMLEAAQLSPDAIALGINSMTRATTGKDLLALSGAVLTPPVQDMPLTPTQISKECYDVGPRMINRVLVKLGLQRNVAGRWIPTERGKQYARLESINKSRSNGTPIVQLKWYSGVIPKVRAWLEKEYDH